MPDAYDGYGLDGGGGEPDPTGGAGGPEGGQPTGEGGGEPQGGQQQQTQQTDYSEQLRQLSAKLDVVTKDRDTLLQFHEQVRPHLPILNKLGEIAGTGNGNQQATQQVEIPYELRLAYENAPTPEARQQAGMKIFRHLAREEARQELETTQRTAEENRTKLNQEASSRMSNLTALEQHEDYKQIMSWASPRVKALASQIESNPEMAKSYGWLYQVPPENWGVTASAYMIGMNVLRNKGQLDAFHQVAEAADAANRRAMGIPAGGGGLDVNNARGDDDPWAEILADMGDSGRL